MDAVIISMRKIGHLPVICTLYGGTDCEVFGICLRPLKSRLVDTSEEITTVQIKYLDIVHRIYLNEQAGVIELLNIDILTWK